MKLKSSKLTDGEVNQLLIQFKKTHRNEIRALLVEQYVGLVESIAHRFAGSAEPIEDLAQEGYIGLISAIDGFDPERGIKFSTYATHFVIGQIKHYLRDRGKIIKEPAWLQELNQRITRTIDALTQQLSRTPTTPEIAALLGMTEDGVEEILTTREVFKVGSLDATGEEDDDTNSTDLERTLAEPVVNFQLPLEEKVVLEGVLERLKKLEQRGIYEHFYREMSQTDIAKQLGISCNYVSHILRTSTRKLKKMFASEALKEAHLTELRESKRKRSGSPSLEMVADPSSGLYNAKYFEYRLSEELQRASRSTHEVAVLYVGVSNLRELSNGVGNLGLQDAMSALGRKIRTTVRRADITCRMNEAEFAIIMPYTGDSVKHVKPRIEEAVMAWQTQFRHLFSRMIPEIQMGAAIYPYDSGVLADIAKERAIPMMPSEITAPRAA